MLLPGPAKDPPQGTCSIAITRDVAGFTMPGEEDILPEKLIGQEDNGDADDEAGSRDENDDSTVALPVVDTEAPHSRESRVTTTITRTST